MHNDDFKHSVEFLQPGIDQSQEYMMIDPAPGAAELPEVLVELSPHHASQELSASEQVERELVEAKQHQLLAAEREQRLLAETLGEVFLALTAQTSHEAVLDEILRQVQRLVSYSAANIMLLEDNVLRPVRAQGYKAYGIEAWVSNLKQSLNDFPLDAAVIQSRQSLVVADTQQNSAWVTVPESAWVRSFIATPICLQDRVLGLLRLDSDIPEKFSAKDLNYLQPLANAAAIALKNAEFYEKAQQEITERKQVEEALKKSEANLAESEARLLAEMQSVLVITEALVSEINLNNLLEFIITQAEHLLNASGAAVLFLSEDGQYLEVATPSESWLRIRPGSRLLVDGSLAEQAILTRQTQRSNQVLGDSRAASMLALLESAHVSSLLCAPLLVRSKNLGVLMIWNEHERVFDTQDRRLANLFADQAALALHNAHLHARNRQLAIKGERHRLARELHDSVTQSLYSIGLTAQTALRLLGQEANSSVRGTIEYIHTLSQTALAEMRQQLYHLHPTVLTEDLVEALTQHCKTLRKQYGLAINFKANLPTSLSTQQRDALYFIVREALWNIVRHAQASHVNIVLAKEQDQILLVIEDDGVGFDPLIFAQGNSMGLRNMAERARMLDGTVDVQSKIGHGTRIVMRAPI